MTKGIRTRHMGGVGGWKEEWVVSVEAEDVPPQNEDRFICHLKRRRSLQFTFLRNEDAPGCRKFVPTFRMLLTNNLRAPNQLR